jgi:hypothetical protein
MFQVKFYPSIEKNTEPFCSEHVNLFEAFSVKNAISDYTLKLHSDGLMQDYSNCAEVCQFIDGEWTEINEQGEVID